MLMPFVFVVAAVIIVSWVNGGRLMPRGLDRAEVVLFAGLGVIGIALMGVFGMATSHVLGELLPRSINDQPSVRVPLVNLRSVDGISGHLRGNAFMLVGNMGSQRYYYWYERAGEAVTPRQEAVGVGVYVYEQDRQDAVLEVYDWGFKPRGWRWIAQSDFGKTWRFYVPKGTIQEANFILR